MSGKIDNTRRRNVQLKRIAGGECSVCGYKKNFSALDFHHVDPATKEFDVCGKKRTMYEKINEIKKCILLCRNCHAELHNPQYAAELFDQVFVSTSHPSWNCPRPDFTTKLFDPEGLLTPEESIPPRLNKSGSPVVERCRERVLRMQERGIHRDVIAKRCGISVGSVYKICKSIWQQPGDP